jgi:hypothetical protein
MGLRINPINHIRLLVNNIGFIGNKYKGFMAKNTPVNSLWQEGRSLGRLHPQGGTVGARRISGLG